MHEPEKELAAAFRPPAVEPKGEFIQVVGLVLRRHCALVGTEQPLLQQPCDPVNARHQRGGVLPPPFQYRDLPLIPLLVQSRVALPTIGVEQTPRLDAILNEGVQARGRGVFNDPHPNPPNARTIGLGGYDDHGFTFGLPAGHTLFQSTYHGFIHLDPALQPVPIRPHHRTSQLMQPRPGSLITSPPQHALQPLARWLRSSDSSHTTSRGTRSPRASACPGKLCLPSLRSVADTHST